MSVKIRICFLLTMSLGLVAHAKEKVKAPVLSVLSPMFSVPGGVYTNDVTLHLNAPASSAVVHYTLDGSEPTERSPVASVPLLLTNCVVVRSRAFDKAQGGSAIVSHVYTLLGPDVLEFSSDLPLVLVNTFGREMEPQNKCISAVRVVEKRNGRATLMGAADFDGRAVMSIRGRASLRYPKRSYTVKLIGDDDDYAAASMLGMPAEWDWILYAPFPDKTLMRDVLAYELHNQMGYWAPRTRFVEVFVNQENRKLSKADYVGVYVFEERVKRDKNRVDLKKLDPTDNSEPKLTGGYIFKKDHTDRGYFGQPDLTGGGAGQSSASNRPGFPTGPGGFPASPAGFLPPFTGRMSSSSSSSSSRSSSSRRSRPIATTNHVGVPQRNEIEINRSIYYMDDDEYIVQKEQESFKTTLTTNRFYFVEPEVDEITAVQKAWLKAHVNQVEAALYGPDFKDPVKGYRAFLEVNSFIDHHLVVEISKNVDGFRFSTFFSKNRGGKIRMEPIWDWNLSFGNANGKQGWIPQYWLWPQLDDREYTWFRRLFEDADFAQRYVDRWSQLRTNLLATSNVLARVDELAAMLDGAQKRNFERWPILGLAVNPNTFVGQSYEAEVNWMKDWISNRLDWIEKQFLAAPTVEVKREPASTVVLRVPKAKIYYNLDGSDPRAPGGTPAASAKVFEAPIPWNRDTRLFARALDGTRWSAPVLWDGQR
jgi:hypothetical protein